MDASKIKMLVMDVDGTLTDGRIYMGSNGEVMKAFDVKDGYAIANMLPKMGIVPVVITGRQSGIVLQRCRELGIEHVYQGESDKLKCLKTLLAKTKTEVSSVAYIGDDVNDYECMKYVRNGGGLVACPFDAANEIIAISHIASTKKAGFGALRDLVERITEVY